MKKATKKIEAALVTKYGVRSLAIEPDLEAHKRAIGGDILPFTLRAPGLDKVIGYRLAEPGSHGVTLFLGDEAARGPLLFVGEGRNGASRSLATAEAAMLTAWAKSEIEIAKMRLGAEALPAKPKATPAPDYAERIGKALEILTHGGLTDGAHHKQWSIDQAMRALTGDGYAEFVKALEDGEDGPKTYEWDTGIPA